MKKSILLISILILLNIGTVWAPSETDVSAPSSVQHYKSASSADGWEDITVYQAWNMIQNGSIVLLDVRTLEEYWNERIQGAKLFPVQYMENYFLTRICLSIYWNSPVIVYCRTGHRSLNAVKILIDYGFNGELYNMLGGITAWKEAGFPVVNSLPIIG